jgi:D-aspartate ligase
MFVTLRIPFPRQTSGIPAVDGDPDQIRSSVPAVVVGANSNGLGIVRTLGRSGIPVIIVDKDERLPGMHSRYARPVLVKDMSGPALVEGLLALRAGLDENPLLFLTYDQHVSTVAKHWEELRGAFRMRLPERDCLFALMHKSGFQTLAEAHGFAVPRSVSLRNEKDLYKLRELRFPVIVKPGSKDSFFNNLAPRACKLTTLGATETLCRQILPRAPDLIVQEWIEGGETDIYFCLQYRGREGATIASFTGRKLRTWPPLTGNTLTCVAAPEVGDELERVTTAFFDTVGFTGMCGMEFKREPKSGRFIMVEPTVARTDWQAEIATLCGVSLPLAAYCHELGLPLPARKPPTVPVIWRGPSCYWRSVIITRRLDRGPVGAKVVRAMWRRDDPVPLFFYWWQWLLRLAHWRRSDTQQSVVETMVPAPSVEGGALGPPGQAVVPEHLLANRSAAD